MSLNLDIDTLPPEKVEAAISRLEAMKAQCAAENKLAHYRPYPKQVAFHAAGVRSRAASYCRKSKREVSCGGDGMRHARNWPLSRLVERALRTAPIDRAVRIIDSR